MREPPAFARPRVMPPVWLALALLAMYALHRWLPLAQLFGHGRWLVGSTIAAIALGMLGWAAAAFLRARTGLVPFSTSTVLVTSGLYRVSRNPMYLGMMLLLTGVAVGFGSLSPWLPVAMFAGIIQRRFIRNEERFLREIHGEAYRAYCDRVRRWI